MSVGRSVVSSEAETSASGTAGGVSGASLSIGSTTTSDASYAYSSPESGVEIATSAYAVLAKTIRKFTKLNLKICLNISLV